MAAEVKGKLKDIKDALSELSLISEYFRYEEKIAEAAADGADSTRINKLLEEQREVQEEIDRRIAERAGAES